MDNTTTAKAARKRVYRLIGVRDGKAFVHSEHKAAGEHGTAAYANRAMEKCERYYPETLFHIEYFNGRSWQRMGA